MSTLNYKWTYTLQDKNRSQVLQNSLNIPENVASLLNDRDIYDFDQAKQFFRPKLNDFYDPFLMKGMMEAVVRLEKAIELNEEYIYKIETEEEFTELVHHEEVQKILEKKVDLT